MGTPFKDMTPEQKAAEFDKFQEKRLKKPIESPAKRGTVKNLVAKYADEFNKLKKTAEANLPKKVLTADEIAAKVAKFQEKLEKGTGKAPVKRWATKKLIEAHKDEYEDALKANLAEARGQTRPASGKGKNR